MKSKACNLLFLFQLLLLLACTTEAEVQKAVFGYTQQDIRNIGSVCRSEVVKASKLGETDRWSKWAICEKKYKMPLDIEMFNVEATSIEKVYDNRIKRFIDLERKFHSLSARAFQMELNEIYDLYDKEKSKTGANVCKKWAYTADGTGNKTCVEYPSIF